jgi:hypothetical protein
MGYCRAKISCAGNMSELKNTSRLDSVYMATEKKAENSADCQKDSSAVTYS